MAIRPEDFAKWLSQAGNSLRRAAEVSGIDKSALSRWKNGRGRLSGRDLRALEDVVGAASPDTDVAAPAPPDAAGPAPGTTDSAAIAIAQGRAPQLMQACVELGLDKKSPPQVRVSALKTALGYALGRPVLLEKKPAQGPTASQKEKLKKALEKMAAGINLAEQLVLPTPEPPAPAVAQDQDEGEETNDAAEKTSEVGGGSAA